MQAAGIVVSALSVMPSPTCNCAKSIAEGFKVWAALPWPMTCGRAGGMLTCGATLHMKVVRASWPAIRAMLMERPAKGDATVCDSGGNVEARYSGALAGTISLTEQQRRPVRLDTVCSTISQPAWPPGQITAALATMPRLQPSQECGLPDLERASTGMVGAAESLHMARMMRMQQP